jgi:hypothetical protein
LFTICIASTHACCGVGEGDALGLGEGVGVGDALGLGDALGEALGDAEGVGEEDGDAEALGVGDACVTVMVVTPFSVVAVTRAPEAPSRNTPEIAPDLMWMKSAMSLSIMPV